MANIVLTARRISPNINRDLTQPRMSLLQTELIVKAKPFKKGTNVLYGDGSRPFKKYRMAETPQEYEVAQRIAAGLTSVNSANVAASGTNQAQAQAITAYHNVVTGAGAASTGVVLPAASTKFNNGGAFVVRNDTAFALSVYPAASEFIDSGASNAPATVAAFSRIHLYASASNRWLSAGSYE